MAGLCENTKRLHKDCGAKRIKKDEVSVQAVLESIKTGSNPSAVEDTTNLFSISSAVVVPDDIAANILNAYTIREKRFVQFINEILKSSKVSFYDTLPNLKLKTFSAEVKTTYVKMKGQELTVRADRNLFTRLLIVAQTRSLNMRDVLCYELDPVPWSLASVDESLAKNCKVKTARSVRERLCWLTYIMVSMLE